MGVERSLKREKIVLGDQSLDVVVREIPFREGVELSCHFEGKEIKVSDLGLGEAEAFRLLKTELEKLRGLRK